MASTGSIAVHRVDVDGQIIRVGIRKGNGGTPLLIFNGIGATLELVGPFTAALAGVETIVFDVPGVGGSPAPASAYRFPDLARLVSRMLIKLGYNGAVDVLGVSWGGAAAQEFAHCCPDRCRRLILAATTAGMPMIPGNPLALLKLLTPRRYTDPGYLSDVAEDIYGEVMGADDELPHALGRDSQSVDSAGYYYQLMAMIGWTSALYLHSLRQPTLIMASLRDLLVPIANSRLLSTLIPDSRMHVVDGGHMFLITRAVTIAPAVREFLATKAVA